MNHALVLNLAIIALILTALVITGNPLALLAIVLIRDMPYGLLQSDDEDEDEEEEKSNPIGFVHHDT